MRTYHTQLPGLAKLTLLFFSILLIPALSHAREESVSWLANPEPVTGYKLYYKTGETSGAPYNGTDLNEGSSPILTGNVTTFTVTGMSPNETYHFVLTAYNATEESGYSDIVSFAPIPFAAPAINSISHN